MPEPVDLDALASAYIDDELDAADRGAAEGNADVMAKVAEFRQIAELLRSPVSIDASVRERSIAAALGHLDLVSTLDSNPSSTPVGDVTTLAPRRGGRTRRSWRSNPAVVWGPIGLAAAALMAVAIVSLDSGDDGDSSSAATTFSADAGDAAASAKAGGAADEASSNESASATRAAASATTAAAAATTVVASASADTANQAATSLATGGLTDLGSVDSASELGARLLDRDIAGTDIAGTGIAGTGSDTTAPTAPAATSTPLPIACPGLGEAVAIATLDGASVVVHVDPRGGFVIVDSSCEQVSRLDAAGVVTP